MGNTVILLGMPGVGKSTVLHRLKSSNVHFRQFSVRLFTMQLLQGDSELGRYLRENNIVRPKAFMPDSVVEQIFAEFLKSLDAGDFLVIEGFPINHVQFHGMKRQLDRAGRQLDRVIVLDDEPDSILARIALRRVCPACELKNGAGLPVPAVAVRCPYCGGPLARRAEDDEAFFGQRCELFRQQLSFLSELLPPEKIMMIDVGKQNATEVILNWRNNNGG